MVTVVDLFSFEENLNNVLLAKLLIDQVEFSNVIVLNKVDLVSEEKIERIKKVLRTLNPSAKLVQCEFGRVAFDTICGTDLFSLENAHQNKGWLKVLRGEEISEGGKQNKTKQ